MNTKIGLVDDHQLFLDGLVAVLSRDNHFQVVFAANNVKSALDNLSNNEIDILITDISMPDINGIEFIKILKDQNPQIKILVLSMFEGTIPHHQINGYIKKESSMEELIFAVKEITKGKNYFQGTDEKIFNLEFNKNIVTNREKDVIKLIASGLSTDQIADKLHLSRGTIETHKKNIYLKLNVKTAPEVVKKAMQLGIIN